MLTVTEGDISSWTVKQLYNFVLSVLESNPQGLATEGSAGSSSDTGVIVATGRATVPDGWLECDGSAVSRTTYAALFDAIGTEHGAGDGSTTFNLPALRGRTIVGYNPAETEFNSIGESGGAKTVTLTGSEMPSHTHTGPSHTHTGPSHTHNFSGGSVVLDGGGALAAAGSDFNAAIYNSTTALTVAAGTGNTGSGGTGSTGSAGSGSAHNNLQPYRALLLIIKT